MSTNTSTQQQAAKNILQSELDCINKLLQSLELEYEVLAENHAEALEDVVRSKQEMIVQLEAITRQREQILVSFDDVTVDDKQDSARHYRFHGDAQLTGLWDELVTVAEKCREKNRVNGSIVESISRQSRHALDILQGIVPDLATSSGIYDNAGQTKSYANKRSLVHV